MNFYLSATDDLLRHDNDAPSIGIIMCKGRNEVVVEYALRDTAKPMGVTQYRLTHALSDQLREELPTSEDLAREFPMMSLVSLRIEIERQLNDLAGELPAADLPRIRRGGLRQVAELLAEAGVIPPDLLAQLARVSQILNAAAHPTTIASDEASAALAEGSILLERLKSIHI